MGAGKYSFLSKHFSYQKFEMNTSNEFHEKSKPLFIHEDVLQFKYGCCFIENETREIIFLDSLSSHETNAYESFQFYLDQLPNLDLQNIAYMLNLISNSTNGLLQNAFEFPKDYSSEFCKILTKETYGIIFYRIQLMELLKSCLPIEENSLKELVEYTRMYNCRQYSFFKKMETLVLPDGFNLTSLLEKYTLRKENSGIGFVYNREYNTAYLFKEKVKKYLQNEHM